MDEGQFLNVSLTIALFLMKVYIFFKSGDPFVEAKTAHEARIMHDLLQSTNFIEVTKHTKRMMNSPEVQRFLGVSKFKVINYEQALGIEKL